MKGLEFEHAVIIEQPNMTKEHWYVALTRATQSITVLSPAPMVTPFVKPPAKARAEVENVTDLPLFIEVTG